MKNKISIPIDKTISLDAQTLPLKNSDGKISYKSEKEDIATVNETGIVTAIMKGTCTVIATSVDGGYTAKCEVTVTQPVEALSLVKHSLTLKVGDNEKLFAQISPANADDKSVTWSSSDKIIASVDANGNVTAKKAGETWIKAISQDNPETKDSCLVTVNQPVLGISLNHKTYEMGDIGESVELIATIAPDDASNKNVKWTSSNESVCIVSHGLVVGVGYGTAVIIANTEDGGYMATCTINVVNTTGLSSLENNVPNKYHIYNVNGAKLTRLQKGINIIRFADGTIKKVLIK